MVIRDNIHGDIEFSSTEANIINSNIFQRLRNIKQLSFADFVFPGATHTRFPHSLGVVQCVTDMYNSVCTNCPSFYREGDLELLRLMALLHDLCHTPFSHASEELSTIDHEERLTEALELLSDLIVIPNNYNCKAWELVDQVYQGYGNIYLRDSHLMALHDFMDNFIDADKLDYLERDALHCGVRYGNFDRQGLVSSLTMIDDNLAITSKGVSALESFVLARYYMFKEVYFHPDERMMRMLYCQEMKHLLKDGIFPENIKKFLTLDDTKFVNKLKCIKHNPFTLVLDVNFDIELKDTIDRLLSDYLICDCPRKSLFRSSEDDQNIQVIDTNTGNIQFCTEVSPVLRGIEFESIHKLRYYTTKEKYDVVSEEVRKVVSRYNENKKR